MGKDRPHGRVAVSRQRGCLRMCLVLLLLAINDVSPENTTQHPNDHRPGNPLDRTVVRTSTTNKILALKQRLLESLGLPSEPASVNGKNKLIDQSACKFLLDVYKRTSRKRNENKLSENLERSEFELTESDLKAMGRSDVITTFMAQRSHRTSGGKLDGVPVIWFDVRGVPTEDHVTSAQLRFYRGRDAGSYENGGAFTVAVFRVMRVAGDRMDMQFVDSANTAAGHEGWITVDVTKPLRHWVKHPGANMGLYVSVHPANSSAYETKPRDIGIVWLDGDAKRRHPFMVGFFGRSASDRARRIQPPRFDDHNKRKRRATGRRSCRVKNFYVSFKDLQWQDWIVAPLGFKANYCSGLCDFPLGGPISVTNHATMQTRLNLYQPEKIPGSCCAPTKLSPINIIYYVSDNTTTLRNWKDMSVRGCGCY